MSDLKPCPFCEGKAKMVTSITRSLPNYPSAYIVCEICRASTQCVADLKQDGSFILKVIELWNERAGDSDEDDRKRSDQIDQCLS